MSSGGGGVVVGMLFLGALDALVSTSGAGEAVGGLGNVGAVALQRLLSPAVPAIPVRGTSTHPYQRAASQVPATDGSGGGALARISPATLRTRPTAPRAPGSTSTTTTVNV